MKSFCLYHRSDLDGKCSAAIVSRYFEPELIGLDYGDDFGPLVDRLMVDDQYPVYVVDFSLPIPLMQQLATRPGGLVWIDHHVSAIQDATAAGFECSGIRAIGRAACELTWEWFNRDETGATMPPAVRMLGRYDVWDQSSPDYWKDFILPFQYGMRQDDWSPAREEWRFILDSHPSVVAEIHKVGSIILLYQARQDVVTMRQAFETTLDGLPVLACCTDRLGSQTFESRYDPAKHAAMLAFHFRPGVGWRCGLYTTRDDIDCSALAKAHGGGGHRQAAGFQCDALPFGLPGRGA